jgi:hypothetical protein
MHIPTPLDYERCEFYDTLIIGITAIVIWKICKNNLERVSIFYLYELNVI